MANPKVIKEFFAKNLPAHILARIDLSTIIAHKDSFIDDKLRVKVADLLYSVDIEGEPGYLYLLMEHASQPDRLLPYRLLKYMIAVMDNHLIKTKSKTLPVVYPLVLYTGRKSYTYSTDLFELFGTHKQLAQETLYKPYQLIDLSHLSNTQLEEYHWFKAAALLSKHIHEPNFLPFFKRFLIVLKELEQHEEWEYIYVSLSYIIEAGDVSDKQEFFNTIRNLEFIEKEQIMTIAEQLRQEGYRQAMEQSEKKIMTMAEQLRQEGYRQAMEQNKELIMIMAKQLLAEDLSVDMIAKVTGISIQDLKKLRD